jgi:hypothetical protein
MSEQINSIKNSIFRHPDAVCFKMERVPRDTVEVFKKYANEHFVGDYGMAFKKLVDLVLVDNQPFTQIYMALEDHEARLAKLEKVEPDFKFKKMLSGRELKIPIRKEVED